MTSLFSGALEMMLFFREITPFYGRTSRGGELLQFTQIYDNLICLWYPVYLK